MKHGFSHKEEGQNVEFEPAAGTHRRHTATPSREVSFSIQVRLQAMAHSHLSSPFRQNPSPPRPIPPNPPILRQLPLLHRPRNRRPRRRSRSPLPSRPNPKPKTSIPRGSDYRVLQWPSLHYDSTRHLLHLQPNNPAVHSITLRFNRVWRPVCCHWLRVRLRALH